MSQTFSPKSNNDKESKALRDYTLDWGLFTLSCGEKLFAGSPCNFSVLELAGEILTNDTHWTTTYMFLLHDSYHKETWNRTLTVNLHGFLVQCFQVIGRGAPAWEAPSMAEMYPCKNAREKASMNGDTKTIQKHSKTCLGCCCWYRFQVRFVEIHPPQKKTCKSLCTICWGLSTSVQQSEKQLSDVQAAFLGSWGGDVQLVIKQLKREHACQDWLSNAEHIHFLE